MGGKEKVEKAEAESINMNFLFDGFYGRLHFRRLAESRFMDEGGGRGSEKLCGKGHARKIRVPTLEKHTLIGLFAS